MISPLAYVHPDAKIGKDVTIEPFAYVAGNVVIGDGTWLGPHAVVLDGARIGKDCKIHSGAVISGTPQDLKFAGEDSIAVLGDNVTVRECATVNRGTAARGETIVGSNTLIMACAHVGHDCIVGNNVVLVNAVLLAGEVEIGDWAILGGDSKVHQFCKVGAHAMIGGGMKVSKDVPPFVKAAHEPLSFVAINTIGLRRRGFSNETIFEIQDMARILFQSNLSYTNGCNEVEAKFPKSEHRDMIIDFIRSSKRGCLKQYQSVFKDHDVD